MPTDDTLEWVREELEVGLDPIAYDILTALIDVAEAGSLVKEYFDPISGDSYPLGLATLIVRLKALDTTIRKEMNHE